ncbi:hypothetical protein OMP38_30265 [Cohnella ginsengisoli]|uniref:Uncharacterized protein n=1 Tax=Cohnella ginsengisoli TaxID=425004 RepID=A0A9X4KNE6_9BACL|nr:hypothetical protein [Cohnella ginsengisoli]MDG0794649.1 hypothetical protein [Cohnella ginsengisoli]
MMMGYKHIPFSRDEMDKKPEMCRRMLYELLGKYGGAGDMMMQASIYAREIVKNASNGKAFKPQDAQSWLQLKRDKTRKVLRAMLAESWVDLAGGSERRNHQYKLTDKGWTLLRR